MVSMGFVLVVRVFCYFENFRGFPSNEGACLFRMHDEPESPNEGACLTYDEPGSVNEGSGLRYMMNPHRQMRGRVEDR